MAYICPHCHVVHPPGAVTCEQAREQIAQARDFMNARIVVHRDLCRGCPDPRQHLLNLDRLDQPRSDHFRVFGQSS